MFLPDPPPLPPPPLSATSSSPYLPPFPAPTSSASSLPPPSRQGFTRGSAGTCAIKLLIPLLAIIPLPSPFFRPPHSSPMTSSPVASCPRRLRYRLPPRLPAPTLWNAGAGGGGGGGGEEGRPSRANRPRSPRGAETGLGGVRRGPALHGETDPPPLRAAATIAAIIAISPLPISTFPSSPFLPPPSPSPLLSRPPSPPSCPPPFLQFSPTTGPSYPPPPSHPPFTNSAPPIISSAQYYHDVFTRLLQIVLTFFFTSTPHPLSRVGLASVGAVHSFFDSSLGGPSGVGVEILVIKAR